MPDVTEQTSKSMNRILAIGLACIMANLQAMLCFSQGPVDASSYFPLIEGAKYWYRGIFEGTEYSEEILVKKVFVEDWDSFDSRGKEYYYFDDAPSDESGIISSNMFGMGLYQKDSAGIWTIEAFFKTDIVDSRTMARQLLLPDILSPRDRIKYTGSHGDPAMTLSYEGFENVGIISGKYNDCLKLKIVTRWDDGNTYVQYIWLARNIGMIKWKRNTGRIDELVRYTIVKAE